MKYIKYSTFCVSEIIYLAKKKATEYKSGKVIQQGYYECDKKKIKISWYRDGLKKTHLFNRGCEDSKSKQCNS